MPNRDRTNQFLNVCSLLIAGVGVVFMGMAIYESIFGYDVRVAGIVYKVCMGILALGSAMAYKRSKMWGFVLHGSVFVMSLPFLTVFPEIKYDMRYLVYFAIPIILLLLGFVLVFSRVRD